MTFIHEYTQRLQEITLGFVSRFSKGRSRVWLMSKPSWTEWLANTTPWFQLTTYRRQQRTKREGNTNGCIVHCIDTLELYTYIWAGKLTKSPTSVIAHSGFTKMIFVCFQIFWCSGGMERGCVEVWMREVVEAWLCFCAFFHCECYFVRGISLWKYGHTTWQPGQCAELLTPLSRLLLHPPGVEMLQVLWLLVQLISRKEFC